MSRSRRPRPGLWIATFSDGTTTRIVAKDDRGALRRALAWGGKKGLSVATLHEVI